jgi:hypothetical protein
VIEPTPNPAVFRAYWRFAAERQAIFERRLCGAPAPWTEDSILRDYRFCNVFRAADRVASALSPEHPPGAAPVDSRLAPPLPSGLVRQ